MLRALPQASRIHLVADVEGHQASQSPPPEPPCHALVHVLMGESEHNTLRKTGNQSGAT